MINDFFSFSFFSCYYCEEYVKNERVGGIFRIIIIKYFLHNFFPAFFFLHFNMRREKVNYNISYVFLEVMRISLFVYVCVRACVCI